MYYSIIKAIATFIFRIFGKMKVVNQMTQPEGGVILAANHISDLDPPVLACASKRPVYFLAKKELFNNFLANWFLRSLKAYPLDRDKGDLAAIKQALRILKSGQILGVFPDGTRSKNGKMQQAKNGAAFLAMQAKAPIVPVAISGTQAGFKGLFVGQTRILVKYGQPISVEEIEEIKNRSDLDNRQKLAMISNEIMSRIASILEEWQ